MTTLTEDSLPRRISLPVLFSVGLHAAVIGAILYASFHQAVQVPKASQPISVSMVAPEVQPEPQAAPQPEPVAQPEPEPVKPQPVAEPEPPVPVPVPLPKPQPKPKPKPKPVKKEVVKPKKEVKPRTEPQQASPFNNDKPATATKPATAPRTSPAPSTAVSTGPEAISVGKPEYPSRAWALRMEGRVRVQFDVDGSGQVVNIRILSAEPRNLFEREVRQAMKKWRYQAGKPGKDLTMNIVFKLKGGSNIE